MKCEICGKYLSQVEREFSAKLFNKLWCVNCAQYSERLKKMNYELDQDLIADGASREVAMLEKIQQIIAQDGEIASDYQVLDQIIKSLEVNNFIKGAK